MTVRTALLPAVICTIAFGHPALAGGPLPGAQTVIDAADYSSLQAAVDALPATGGIVRIPPGEFELAESLRVPGENVHLAGAGPASVLKNNNQSGAATIAVHPPLPTDGQATDSSRAFRWRVQISDLRLIGNEKSGPGIDALRVNEIFLHGLTVTAHGGDGIRLDNCYEDPRVSDCLITYNKQTGLNLLGCHDIVVSANQFEENQDALHCIDGYNLCMTGNNIDDHLGDGVVIENTYGSVVSGNMIEECNGWAVILDRDCYGDTLSANVIAHNGGGVDLRDAHGCAVSANTFTLLKTHALRIAAGSGRITVTGNNFSNSFIGGDQVKRKANDLAAAGITLDGTRDITITGNVFSGLTTAAIVQTEQPSKRIAIVANVFAEVESEHAGISGVETSNVGAHQ